MDDGKNGYELEILFEEAETDTASTEPEELWESLHTGKILEAYKEVILAMKVAEVRRKVKDDLKETEKTRIYLRDT